jgi:hypothetical protein
VLPVVTLARTRTVLLVIRPAAAGHSSLLLLVTRHLSLVTVLGVVPFAVNRGRPADLQSRLAPARHFSVSPRG